MPATITHACFAKEVYNKLNPKYQKLIKNDKNSLLMFSQSMDSMMFYNLLSLHHGKQLRLVAPMFHSTNTYQYFYNLITYIKTKKYYTDPQTLCYLYGFICHYCLDTTTHPYIFYKTGLFNKKDKNSYKYNCLHNYMETYIDNVIIEKYGYDYQNLNFKNLCFDFKSFSKELKDSINYSFEVTYNLYNMDNIYYKSLKQMCQFLQLFRFDKYGIKKAIYKFFDMIKPAHTFKLECLSYYKVLDNYNYLNLNKSKWYYPVDKNITSNKTFWELYEDALKDTIDIINGINDYFFDDKKINLTKLFKNKSYVTGVDCSKKLKQKYFKF